jgi:hypothetical protein
MVFEFWEQGLHGTSARSFAPGTIPGRYNSQVFEIRGGLPHPPLAATRTGSM